MHNRPGRNLDRTVFLVATTISESLPSALLSLSLLHQPTNNRNTSVETTSPLAPDSQFIAPLEVRSRFFREKKKEEEPHDRTTFRRILHHPFPSFRVSVMALIAIKRLWGNTCLTFLHFGQLESGKRRRILATMQKC